jgi:hypothetical protein
MARPKWYVMGMGIGIREWPGIRGPVMVMATAIAMSQFSNSIQSKWGKSIVDNIHSGHGKMVMVMSDSRYGPAGRVLRGSEKVKWEGGRLGHPGRGRANGWQE